MGIVTEAIGYGLLGLTLVCGVVACAGAWGGDRNLWGGYGDAKLNTIRAFLIIDIVFAASSLGTAIAQRWLIATGLQLITGFFSIIPWAIYVSQISQFSQIQGAQPATMPPTMPPSTLPTFPPTFLDPYGTDVTGFPQAMDTTFPPTMPQYGDVDIDFYQYGFVFAVLVTGLAIPATGLAFYVHLKKKEEMPRQSKQEEESPQTQV